jgi:drug/metabolite transporter (DMT)-like permease
MGHTWVFLSLLSAFSLATSDALAKKSLEDGNEYLVAWLRLVFTLPLLFVTWLFVPAPPLDNQFYEAFLVAMPVELVTVVLYVKALKASPLSLTLPFLAITPVALIVASYVVLGEEVSARGAAGIFLIAAGSYVLNIGRSKGGLWAPFRTLAREKGSLMMICVAVLYSITSSFGKMAIEHSSPLFFGITYFTVLTIFFTPIGLLKARKEWRSFRWRKHIPVLGPCGFFYGIMIVAQMIAMHLTNVAYMISVKRISLLIGVVYGYLFFREGNIKERLAGALIMFAGFVLVVAA